MLTTAKTSRGNVAPNRLSNAIIARANLNAGHSKAWPVWKERIFGGMGGALRSVGFATAPYGEDYKRMEGQLSCVISPPKAASTSGQLTCRYIGFKIQSTTVDIDEDIAARILAGWSNSALAAMSESKFSSSINASNTAEGETK